MGDKIKFFLGSNTKYGFIPMFDEINKPDRGGKLFVLKGGAGSGKSTMMKKFGQHFKGTDENMEIIPCASDPNSLDAVYVPGKNIAILDGTPQIGRAHV